MQAILLNKGGDMWVIETTDVFDDWRRNSRAREGKSSTGIPSNNAAVSNAKAPFSCFMASMHCCTTGEWKTAATYFATTMNLIWTNIVNPNAGANRKD